MRIGHVLTRALGALAVLPSLTQALLKDRSALPDGPLIGWPQWYRDTNNLAVGLCKSQLNSPNAPGAPMCFPIEPNPASFPGNLGDEVFYNFLNVDVVAGGMTMLVEAALEAAYGSADGSPVQGTEIVFTRIRIRADIAVAGTYTVIHPFGREVFTNVPVGGRTISLTRDLGITSFDTPLAGDVGPFIEWVNAAGTGRTNAGETLNIVDPATGKTERFLGDPNVVHTFKGSPTGFNKVRVEGPVGAFGTAGTAGTNAAGQAISFVEETRGVVMGQEWSIPIPTAFTIDRAIYSRTATLFTADVWATSATGQQLIVTGQGLPSIEMVEGAGGKYYAHIETATAPTLPFSVTVYNLRSTPVNSRVAPLQDVIRGVTATFNRATNALVVTARSSDTSATPPVLSLLDPVVAAPTTMTRDATGLYTFTRTLPVGTATPLNVRVRSDKTGVGVITVAVSAVPQNAAQPTAVDDIFTIPTLTATSMTINVLANDVTSAIPTIIILKQPLILGTVTAPATGGPVTLTRQVPSLTGRDTFQYVLKVGTTISRITTVTLVTAIQGATAGPAPVTAADSFSMAVSSTSVPINVLANDVQAFGGGPVDPTSVQVTNGVAGTAVANPTTGTITYNSPATAGIYTFTYTVASTLGARSAPTSVTVDVRGAAEVVTIRGARFRGGRWTVDGSTSVFSTLLTQGTTTCLWVHTDGRRNNIGSAPIDITGGWAVDSTASTPTPTATTLARVECRTSYGGVGTTTTVRFG